MDSDGFIIRVVVYLDNEQDAVSIEAAINGVDKGANCGYGVVCEIKRVTHKGRIVISSSTIFVLSGSHYVCGNLMMMFLMLLVVTLMMMII